MANKTRSFLDVDSKILENNLTFKECNAGLEEYKALLGINEDGQNPWKLVTPQPGFCVKTVDDEKKKVFINVCTLDDIPEPRDVNEDELLDIIEARDGDDYRVPLSLQEPHEETDKSGNPALCYDVAIHPRFYKKVKESPVFKMFFLQVTFDGLKEKFDTDLEIEDYTILKNRKCIGTLRPHRIRNASKPNKTPKALIEEVSSPAKAKISISSKPLNYRLIRTTKEKKEYLYGEIHLPRTAFGKDVNLEVGEDRVVVESRQEDHLLDIFLPFNLDAENTRSQFSTSTKILHFATPIIVP